MVTWLRRDHGRTRSEPAWQRRLGEASVPAVFLTSVVVDLQPKGLVLGLSSGVVVRAGSMPVAEAQEFDGDPDLIVREYDPFAR